MTCDCSICGMEITSNETMLTFGGEPCHEDCLNNAMMQAELIERSDWSEDFWGTP